MSARWVSTGLGLMVAGAVLHAPLHAQVRDTIPKKRDSTVAIPIPKGADSALRDTMAIIAARDSARRAREKGDTIRAPLAHAELPTELTIGRRLHWNRDSLFATGAITVADLLARVPGLTTFQPGWIAAPAVASYMGDTRRVRVFFDGFEQQALDPRGRGVLDLTQINLWGAEEVTIEPTATEVRVYLRSWRVHVTIPETRTDVATGDQQTNLYRGYYGRRFNSGMALQFGAQQYGTTFPNQSGAGSNQTGLIGRVGWAKTNWSVDGFVTRISRSRDPILRDFASPGDSILRTNSTLSDAYFRVGFADPDTSPLWWQAMAVASKYKYTGVRTDTLIAKPLTAADSAFNAQSLDTNTTRAQYLFTVGTVRGPLRLSATERLFGGGGKGINAPSVRGSYAFGTFGVSAFAEMKGADSIARSDVTAQFSPLPYISLLGSAGRATDERVKDSSLTSSYLRAEVGVRVRNLWLIGGMLRRDSVALSPPTVFDTSYVRRGEASVTGTSLAIRGQVWRLINADVSAIRWNDSTGLYRPRYQTRSELFVKTRLLERYPSGNLGIMASLVHEYRSGVNFPVGDTVVAVSGYRTISSLLEIRILTATISWQFRNFLGERYMQVPGFISPRQTNFYGVRWSFSN